MLKTICYSILKLQGWTFKIDLADDLRSFILLGAPHTSNFDFIPAMALSLLLKRHTRFVIKKEWLKFPLNLILARMGALGIDRESLKIKHGSTTDILADLFSQFSDLVLMIAPEGTRSPNEHWKTGFYYIAQKANVPIVLGFADFKSKIAGTGLVIYPVDFEKDMQKIMEFYQQIHGRKPDNFKLDSRYF